MKILLASVLLLLATAARAADPTPWGAQTSGADWVSATFKNGATCWASAKVFAANGGSALTMYALTKDSVVAGVAVYRASSCPVSDTSKMGAQVMGNGGEMVPARPGTGSMIVAQDDATIARVKKSLAYAQKLLSGK